TRLNPIVVTPINRMGVPSRQALRHAMTLLEICRIDQYSPETVKALLVAIHMLGVALGMGGAFIADYCILTIMRRRVIEAVHVEFLSHLSHLVMVGLALLWVSGLGFLFWYARYTPDALNNPKFPAKIFIVSILTLNGAILHLQVFPFLNSLVGRRLFAGPPVSVLVALLFFGAVSFASWLFPFLFAVLPTADFAHSSWHYYATYLIGLCVVFSLMLLALPFLFIRREPASN
ncbi:MAG: hypothetical protein AAGF59_14715, partial [Pseudomonadota bacterium]